MSELWPILLLCAMAACALLLTICTLWLIYLVGLAAYGLRVRSFPPADKRMRFLLLIAVYNEEQAIGALIQSIRSADYPAGLLQPLFIADHCTDETVAILERENIPVIDRQQGPRGKSHAIALGIEQLLPKMDEDDDLLLILDADNRIDADFFTRMSDAAASGAPILQGNSGIANSDASMFMRVNHLNYCVTNRLKELARSQSGRSCRLRGQGMAFRKAGVDALTWNAATLVEDQELMIDMILKGHRAVWVHDAKVLSVLPETMEKARVQRQRWAGGKSELTGSATSRLYQKYRKTRDRVSLDMMIDFLIPSYAIQLAMVALGLITCVALFGPLAPFSLSFAGLGALYFLYFALGCWLEEVPLRSFAAFLVSPVFIIWRVWIWLTSLRGARRW